MDAETRYKARSRLQNINNVIIETGVLSSYILPTLLCRISYLLYRRDKFETSHNSLCFYFIESNCRPVSTENLVT
jgi:hypothetical protein